MKNVLSKAMLLVLVIAFLISGLNFQHMGLFADVAPVDKLLQNEKTINVADKSYYYADIEKHWAKLGMYKLSYMEILKGFPDGTMKPNNTLTREEYIVMLVRAIDLPLQSKDMGYYSDVTSSQWSYKEINSAKEFGLLSIYSQKNMSPQKVITREEMAVIASAVVKHIPVEIQNRSFPDLSASYKYKENISIVAAHGIILGMPDGRFKPYAGATRAEAAVIIQRLLSIRSAASAGQADILKLVVENYEQSRISNHSQGNLNKDEILYYSRGKDNKQNLKRYSLFNNMETANVLVNRSISGFTSNVTYVSDYMAEVTAAYRLDAETAESITKGYKVSSKLFLLKQNGDWVVYDSAVTYTVVNAINKNEKVNLTWQYVSQRTPDMSSTTKLPGVNVLSPTWFTLINESGDIKSIADVNYSNWAHNNGYQVWALVDNQFDKEMTSKLLANPVARKRAIDSLIKYAKDYKLDGINVDFENMYTRDRDLFTLFVKELYAKTKPLGITLSVDVTVIVSSSNWSNCYDRKALAQVSDYIALMAYDQHWAGSPVSGSVAQITWVENHLKKVLLEVPKEKLLLGVPFYTRVWKEQLDANKNLVVTSSAVSMQTAERLVAENKAVKNWDAASGQYFATYVKDGATYKIWLEDERSIKLKVDLVNKYGLAGASSWRMGFEKPTIWTVISASLTNQTTALK